MVVGVSSVVSSFSHADSNIVKLKIAISIKGVILFKVFILFKGFIIFRVYFVAAKIGE